MNIHVFTQDSVAQERLAALLAEMDLECTVHRTVEPLLRAVKKLTKRDMVLYDLSLEDRLWAFERLNRSCRRTNLVGFELLTKETASGGQHCVDGMGHYLLLPQNMDRAKARMQEVLKEVAKAAAPKKRSSKRRKSTGRKATVSAGVDAAADSQAGGKATYLATARYLQAQSAPMQTFLTQLHQMVGATPLTMIDGEDGAEFELVAREFNFHANGDATPLLGLDPMQLEFDQLRQFEKDAASQKKVHNCYVGISTELNRKSTNALLETIDHLRALAKPHLNLVIGHVNDSESYFCEETGVIMRRLRKHASTLEIPSLSERAADIPLIAQSIFSTLRAAHPFLRARTLSTEAVEFLQAECKEFDYSGLVRVLRNAMALGESETLTEKELKHLDDNSPTTQHLIESLADEKYFNSDKPSVA